MEKINDIKGQCHGKWEKHWTPLGKTFSWHRRHLLSNDSLKGAVYISVEFGGPTSEYNLVRIEVALGSEEAN